MLVLSLLSTADASVKCEEGGISMEIGFLTAADLRAEELAQAKAELREPKVTPSAGIVKITTGGAIIEAADPEQFLVVVFDASSTEIHRGNGQRSVPNHSTISGWWDLILAPLPAETKFPIDVHVIARITQLKCSARVDATGAISKLTSGEKPASIPVVADPADVASRTATPPEPHSYPFAGYMERIRREVNYWWQQNLDNMPSSVRLGRSTYTTEVKVVLNGIGALESIEVSETSGSTELDDAVVRAFRLASPFDNPPDGLVQKNGRVYLPDFDFTVQLNLPRGGYFQGQGKLFPPADLEPE